MKLFGREFTIDQLANGLLILSGVIAFCAFAGQSSLAVTLLISVVVAVLIWAVHLNELSRSPSERFAELRWIVNARRAGESENGNQRIPLPVACVIGGMVALVCTHHLLNARQQFLASNYPSVMGLMTRHEMVDIGMVSSALEVDYQYTLNGQMYQGNRFRFLYRPYRVGTDDAKRLAANWGMGKRIPVFYDPANPADAAIDNTFCKGDQLFVALNALVLVAVSLAGSIWFLCEWTAARPRQPFESRTGTPRAVISLSNLPLYGMLGLNFTAISFGLLLALLIGGMFAMGNGSVTWLVAGIEWMYVITGGMLCTSIIGCLFERWSYGAGRACEVDAARQQIVVRPEGLSDQVTIGFDQIASIQVVSQRDDWFRLCRTFLPTIRYRDRRGATASVILQRDTNRNQAIGLVTRLRQLVGLLPLPSPSPTAAQQREASQGLG